jgi:hypothetical protein
MTPAAAAWLLHAADPEGEAPRPALPLPWAEAGTMLATAEAHGVLPAVLRRLGRLAREDGAAPVLDPWRARLVHQAGRGLLLAHHGQRALDAMAAAGIGATVVKGMSFARRAYPDPALRGFTDVDLLVAEADRAAAGRVLAALGFRHVPQPHHGDEDYAEEKWLLAQDPGVMIELHGNLVHNPRLRHAVRLDRAALLAAGGGDAEDAAALLLTAAVHGATSHQFDRLQHVVDVLLMGRGRAGVPDAARLAAAAAACGATRALAAALAVAARLFGDAACARLALSLGVPIVARAAPLLLAQGVVLRAQGPARGRDSWRRKLFREMLRR